MHATGIVSRCGGKPKVMSLNAGGPKKHWKMGEGIVESIEKSEKAERGGRPRGNVLRRYPVKLSTFLVSRGTHPRGTTRGWVGGSGSRWGVGQHRH